MPQFLVLAKDFNDEQALDRRLAVRANHLQLAARLKESGNLIKGGAFLNETGNMCGSVMIMEFESRQALDSWLEEEPYVLGKVWDSIEISEIRIAPV